MALDTLPMVLLPKCFKHELQHEGTMKQILNVGHSIKQLVWIL